MLVTCLAANVVVYSVGRGANDNDSRREGWDCDSARVGLRQKGSRGKVFFLSVVLFLHGLSTKSKQAAFSSTVILQWLIIKHHVTPGMCHYIILQFWMSLTNIKSDYIYCIVIKIPLKKFKICGRIFSINELHVSLYTVSQKNVPLYDCLYLCQILNRFSKFFYWCILWTVSNKAITEYPITR